MESYEYFQDATVIFVYLIPRGLKKIHSLMMEQRKQRIHKKEVRVVSYMSKLPSETPEHRSLIMVEHHKGAAWPLYFYTLK